MSYVARVTPEERFVEVRSLRHRILHWGPREAEPTWLLHGFQDCADTFQFLVDEMPRERAFIAPDWRGFGGSAHAPAGYWFPDYLADLEALLRTLAPGRPARLIGHSMGGNIATLYAGVRPARVDAVVSLEGFGLPRTDASQTPARYARWLDELEQPPRASRRSASFAGES